MHPTHSKYTAVVKPSMYKINESIPGWSDKRKLEKLAELASAVPPNGWIVEVGSYCGRSAYAMGMNKDDTVKLTCFDKFPDEYIAINETCRGDKTSLYSYHHFLQNTSEVVNLEAVRAYVPINIEYLQFTKQIDLLFIDCIHTYEAVKADIAMWYRFMKPQGVIIFDDYFDMFPGCVQAVDEFVEELGRPVKTEVISCAKIVYL